MASMADASMKLPASLNTFACAGSEPASITPCPTRSNAGRQASTAPAAPPATIQRLADSAASGRPNTGAPT